MRLDSAIALPGGMFHFRLVVGFRLDAPGVIEASDDVDAEDDEVMVGYFRTYGVTAASPSRAVALVEEMLAGEPDDDPAATVEEIEVVLLDAMSLELPLDIDELTEEGVHFESGRAFFSAEDDEPEPRVQ